MGYPEKAYLCEKVLAGPHPALRYVFVELSPVRTLVPKWTRQTRRLVYWHDWPRTWLVIRTILSDYRGWRQLSTPTPALEGQAPIGVLCDHLQAWGHRLAGIGDGAELLQQALGETSSLESVVAGQDAWSGHGYFPLVTTMPEQDRPAWQRMIAKFAEPNTESPSLTAEEGYREFARKVRAAGATMILVTFPNFVPNHRVFAHPDHRDGPPVFAFDRPDEYPSLYLPEHREGQTHVNDAGAREFTRAVAARFSSWLAQEGSATLTPARR
jgi:hypothetical protein